MIQAVVTDIEGTTSSLRFVKDLLFPYARERLANFVRARGNDVTVLPLLEEVRQLTGRDLDLEGIIAQLLEWSDRDEKIAPLKAIQGMIWEHGYQSGELQGHIYPDAVAALRAWKEKGTKLYVFSSGSIQAQKLLFAHTEWGDLTGLFCGFFDTRIGSKKDPKSYFKIAATIGFEPQEIVFLSDVTAELEAANAAGMKTVWLVREGNPKTETAYFTVKDFSEIDLARV